MEGSVQVQCPWGRASGLPKGENLAPNCFWENAPSPFSGWIPLFEPNPSGEYRQQPANSKVQQNPPQYFSHHGFVAHSKSNLRLAVSQFGHYLLQERRYRYYSPRKVTSFRLWSQYTQWSQNRYAWAERIPRIRHLQWHHKLHT